MLVRDCQWLRTHRTTLRPTHRARHLGPDCLGSRGFPFHRTLCNSSQQHQQHVLLEQAALADMPTEQLIHLLQKHGMQVPDEKQQQQQQQPRQEKEPQNEQATMPTSQQQQQQPAVLQSPTVQQTLQQQQLLAQQKAVRAARVAAAAARRSALLKHLAAARVAARARIVRLPLRLVIAGKQGSRHYLTVPVDVEGVGFVDFLLDGSSYLSRITPGLRSQLGMGPADGVAVVTGRKPSSSSSSSGGGGGSTAGSGSSGGGGDAAAAAGVRLRLRQRVQLPDMWLGTAKLPSQQAYVAPLLLPPRRQQQQQSNSSSKQQLQLPPGSSTAAAAIGGLLGVQVLRCFDIDVDVAGNQLALHPAGHVELGLCDVEGMTPIPCRFTRSGTIVLPVSLAGSPPFTGLLDLSATTSILNWEAAALLGMTCADFQQEQQQQQQHDTGSCETGLGVEGSTNDNGTGTGTGTSSSAKNMYGYFGNIQVVPDGEMLIRPSKPTGGSSSSSSSTDIGIIGQQQQQQQHTSHTEAGPAPDSTSSSSSSLSGSMQVNLPAGLAASLRSSSNVVRLNNLSNSSSSSSKSSSSGEARFTPLRVQQHQIAASAVKLCLGHARLAAVAAAGGSSSGGSGCCLALTPPSRFGVAGLRGLGQLGLAGQPAMVVGADIWARHRAVLCLKSGWLYLADRQLPLHSAPAGSGEAAAY